MPTYQKAPEAINEMANEILTQYECFKPLLDAKVRIDYVFAYADRDEAGNIKNCAIKHHGRPAAGLAKIIKLKDRAMGRADGEITLDHDWWTETASEEQQRAVLDHELFHFIVSTEIDGVTVKTDDLQRPKLLLRKHDFEYGWFTEVALRHGEHSMERVQAKQIMDEAGQAYWPEMFRAINAVATPA